MRAKEDKNKVDTSNLEASMISRDRPHNLCCMQRNVIRQITFPLSAAPKSPPALLRGRPLLQRKYMRVLTSAITITVLSSHPRRPKHPIHRIEHNIPFSFKIYRFDDLLGRQRGAPLKIDYYELQVLDNHVMTIFDTYFLLPRD